MESRENCQNIVISSIQTDRYHIDAWNHDILGVGIGKIEHIVDQLAFLGFDDTVLMTDVHGRFSARFSVMVLAFLLGSICNSFMIPWDSRSTMKMTGVSTCIEK